MKRELDFKLEQLNERRAELKQDQELVKSEKMEISRQKDQLKVSFETLIKFGLNLNFRETRSVSAPSTPISYPTRPRVELRSKRQSESNREWTRRELRLIMHLKRLKMKDYC